MAKIDIKNETLLRKTISENIQKIREEKGLMTINIATRLDMFEEDYAKLETGKHERILNFPTLVKIAEVLEIPYRELFRTDDGYIKEYRIPGYFYNYFTAKENENGFKHTDVCLKAGIDSSAYSYCKSGRNIPSPEILENVMNLLEINGDDLENYEKNYLAVRPDDKPQYVEKKKTTVKNSSNTRQMNPKDIEDMYNGYNMLQEIKTMKKELAEAFRTLKKLKETLDKYN